DGGSGNDYLLNNNTVTISDVDSDAHATGISITAQFSASGVAGGFSLANTSGIANTVVSGLDGGEGNDSLYNLGTLDLDGTATADALSVALNITASVGVGGGAAITDASSEATSTVLGMTGGEGLDDIANEGDIDVASTAVTESTAASVGITVAVGGDVTLADAESTSTATAVGIYDPAEVLPVDAVNESDDQPLTVLHHDTDPDKQNNHKDDPPKNLLSNLGAITSTAGADSEGLAISGNLLGYALGETTNTSTADAAGIRYNQGPVLVYNEGAITANSTATAEGLSVAVTLGGAAVGDTSTTANAFASAIETGSGDDEVANISEGEGLTTTVDARSYASGDSVSVGLVGVQQANTTNTANASAKGIDSGAGNDVILNDAMMSISAGNPLTSDGSANCSQGSDGACAQSFGLNFTLAGYGTVDGTSIANADALGITAGEGDDVIQSEKAITVTSLARGNADAVGITLLGANDAAANTVANATATGLSGDTGDDQLFNAADLTIMAGAEGNADSFSLSIAGASSASANTTTDANATGISGGEGHDKLINESVVAVKTNSQSRADSMSVTIFGDASAGADTITNATSIGLDGGTDNDRILNADSGSIDVNAKTQSTANASSWNFAGAASAAATLGALTDSFGIVGGSGEDWIGNAGSINIGTQSWLTATGGGRNIFGNAEAGAKVTANASASGINTGADDDTVENSGVINVDAYANMLADTTAASFAGSAATSEFVTAEAHAAAIANDSGNISVYNNGDANASVSAEARTQGSASAELAGGTEASGTVATEVSVAGIASDAGTGDLINEGNITANAAGQSWATHSSSAGVFFSDGGVVALSNGRLDADGVAFGDGDNFIENYGDIEVQVSTGSGDYGNDGSTEGIFARARAEGGDFDIFTGNGDASGRVEANGDVAMYGIRLGEGDNRILNEGHIAVTTSAEDGVKATAFADPNGGGFTIDGDGWGEAYTTLNLDARGVLSGNGQFRMINNGEIEVAVAPSAYSGVDADGGSSGDTDVFVEARVTSDAYGISAGEGEHWFSNSGSITVSNTASAAVNGDANGNGIDGDGRVGYGLGLDDDPGYARLDAITAGIDLGEGHSSVLLEGSINLYDETSTNVRAYADSDFTGGANGFARSELQSATYALRTRGAQSWIEHSGDIGIYAAPGAGSYGAGYASGNGSRAWGTALALTQFDSTVHGIVTEGDGSYVLNTGTITINANPGMSSKTDAESNLDGDSNSRAKSVLDLTVAGIEALGAGSVVEQQGDITINIVSSASASSWSRADGALADTRARADATAVIDAHGVGVHVAEGTGTLQNDGNIEIQTQATTNTSTDTEAPGLPKGAENSWSIATAEAFGLWAGAAESSFAINNAGNINVDASSVAQVSTVGSTYMHTEERAVSHAYGIYANDEADFNILNTGIIIATASADSDRNDLGLLPVADAVGIKTGPGNDTIINQGTIDTSRTTNGVTTLGTAIDSGGGDDEVILGDGSITYGDIDLGTGTDTLSMEGTPIINGNIIDDMSSLMLSFNNSGSYEGELPGLSAEKNGEGTFELSLLPQLDNLAVNKGTLQLNRDYIFKEDSDFQAKVYGDGSNGRFMVNGVASLNGQMKVVRGNGAYRDGTTYDVLTASSGIEQGTVFTAIELPEDKPLLKFNLQQQDDKVQVQADVESFTTVAKTSNAMAVAEHLDNILPIVKGDLNNAIGEVQVLSQSNEFADAFYGLSPAAHDQLTLGSFASMQQYTNTVTGRMNNLQFSELVAPNRRLKDGEYKLAANGIAPQGLFMRHGSDYKYGGYVRGFGQRGEQDATADSFGYDFSVRGLTIGLDNKFNNRYIGGASIGYASNDLDADRNTSSGDIESTMISIYGSYLLDKGYFDAVFSYGRNSYDTRRNVTVPSPAQLTSSHDGDLLSLGFSGGAYYEMGDWWLRPYASLQYTKLDEDGFTE
ncbi:MAG: autotransporter outer membrane beta-barrel domain-containing protein, partial [Gammaproteobacteria bacterium]